MTNIRYCLACVLLIGTVSLVELDRVDLASPANEKNNQTGEIEFNLQIQKIKVRIDANELSRNITDVTSKAKSIADTETSKPQPSVHGPQSAEISERESASSVQQAQMPDLSWSLSEQLVPAETSCPDDDHFTDLAPISAEYLHKSLFRCYNKNVRPVVNANASVIIHVGMQLISIEKIDLKTQKELARVMAQLQWVDPRLTWNPSDYGDTRLITVAAFRIWIPDVTVESLTGSFEFVKFADIGRAQVNYMGNVTIWPLLNVKLGTSVDVSKYPFDFQNVSFLFGSWAFPNNKVRYDLDQDMKPLRKYETNVEWKMLECFPYITVYDYSGYEYDRVGYVCTIQRRWLYYAMNVIGPVVLACLLNLLVFALPAVSGQRVTLAISIFLCLTIFLSQINDSLPKTSVGISILVVYLCLQMVGSVMTIASSVFIIYITERGSTPSSSKVISFLCRNIIANLKKSDSISAATGDQKSDSARETPVNQTPEHKAKRSRWPLGSGERRNKLFRRAGEYINNVCLWMSIIWNIVLLIVLFAVGTFA